MQVNSQMRNLSPVILTSMAWMWLFFFFYPTKPVRPLGWVRLTEKGEKINKKCCSKCLRNIQVWLFSKTYLFINLKCCFLFTAIVLIQALTASLHVNKKTFTSTKSHQTGFEVVWQKLTQPVPALVPLLSLDICGFCNLWAAKQLLNHEKRVNENTANVTIFLIDLNSLER